MSSSPFFSVRQADSVWQIELRVSDSTDGAAFNEIHAALVDRFPIPPGEPVVVDLSPTAFAGSMFLGLLINLRQKARQGDNPIVFCGLSARLWRVVQSSQLHRLLPLADSTADAMDQLR
jgi:anti-anti-sigma factor